MRPRIYLDYNATSAVAPEVLAAMSPYFRESFGNASSLHSFGRRARTALERARDQIASALGAEDRGEIIFTSGGTEADNLALRGVARAHRSRGTHIVTSAVEHPAILHTCAALAEEGYEVTTLPVARDGTLRPDVVARALRPETVLLSLMYANNETGVLFPIEEIGAITRERGLFFHVDAVQAFGRLPLSVKSLPVDLLSLSAHKIAGPQGMGALYIRRGTRMDSLQTGGHHEGGRRAGTVNVAGAVGLGAAAELAVRHRAEEAARVQALRDRLEEGILSAVPDVQVNGHRALRLPNTLNVSFRGADRESLLIALDLEGIAISPGSACTSGVVEPSHVLQAMGLTEEWARGAVRFSLGRETTGEEIDRVLEVLPGIVARVREAARPYPLLLAVR